VTRHHLYIVLGIILVVGAVGIDASGWTLARALEGRSGAPRSVRENPGAYRSVYRSSARFRHGK
jgi:hypothetical protein